MFNIGAGELLVILVVALLLLGPKRLPEMARGVGKFLREFRRQTDEVRSVVEREFYRMDQEDTKAPSPASSMPAPKPMARPLSLPYRAGPELRPSLDAIAGKLLAPPAAPAPEPVPAAPQPPAASSCTTTAISAVDGQPEKKVEPQASSAPKPEGASADPNELLH